MVFGEDLLENACLLAGLVDHVEIVLFYTPTLHNFPPAGEVKALKKLGADEDVSFSVHLPAYLEIAARDRHKREESVQLAIDLIHIMDELNPMHHVLHIPFTPPTLTPVPGVYFTGKHRDRFIDWTQRAKESLETIQLKVGQGNKILVENINYSPMFLECFLKPGSCEFCLDLGHLLLGRENVVEVTKQFLSVTREVHLHGVRGFQEHLSLAVLPEAQVNQWIRLFAETSFSGVVNLEVFSPADLEASLDFLMSILKSKIWSLEPRQNKPALSIEYCRILCFQQDLTLRGYTWTNNLLHKYIENQTSPLSQVFWGPAKPHS